MDSVEAEDSTAALAKRPRMSTAWGEGATAMLSMSEEGFSAALGTEAEGGRRLFDEGRLKRVLEGVNELVRAGTGSGRETGIEAMGSEAGREGRRVRVLEGTTGAGRDGL